MGATHTKVKDKKREKIVKGNKEKREFLNSLDGQGQLTFFEVRWDWLDWLLKLGWVVGLRPINNCVRSIKNR